jgi:hypothetical protein
MIVPTEWQAFHTVLVVREPLDRLVGLWHHYDSVRTAGREDEKVLAGCSKKLDWPGFVHTVASDHAWLLPALFRWTIARVIEPVRKIHGLLRYETLQRDVGTLLNAAVQLPGGRRDRQPIESYYVGPNVKRLAEAWATPDMLRFGYERNG